MDSSTAFKSSLEVYEWISGFINLERGQGFKSFRLDRMSALAELCGRPEKCAPSFHIAGTKGKGSVTGMIAAILEAAGTKTALYSSPHVSDFRERISVGGKFFDEETYLSAGRELAALVEKLRDSPLFDKRNENGEEPSFFELMTMWFFLCARSARCKALAVETGMGGRLDATNIIESEAAIITLIELEHTEYLGNTLAAIAGEKAGIIKGGRPLVLAEQPGEALEIFRICAERKKSPLLYFPECTKLREIRVSREGTSFSLAVKKPHDGYFPDLFIPMQGAVQAANAGLAILALKTVCPHITEKAVREGLAGFTLPARFERISEKPLFIVDGAHTKRSVELCLKTFNALYGKGGILVFGCAAGKDLPSMAELCVPCFSRIIITTPGTYKKSFPLDIYKAFLEKAKETPGPEILFIPETDQAVKRAYELALMEELPVLGTGSFYLAGEIRKKIPELKNA
jgi:dihydrofolate synthase/folylpolyglutamate synthase